MGITRTANDTVTSYSPTLPLATDASRSLSQSGPATYVRQFLSRLAAQARKIQVRQNKKRLRVCETVALGDKRFVAVIQVDDQQFLLGGSSNSVSLLAQLEKPASFAKALNAHIGEVDA
ncbi:MAG: flagellar biosynthetic protein FliO [Terriglobales bacterium]